MSKLYDLYYNVVLPLQAVVVDMETNGLYVDKEYGNTLIERYKKQSVDTKAEICDIAGKEFNINSTKELRDILYHKFGLPCTGLTKTGNESTAFAMLEAIKDQHVIIQKILDYRTSEKMLNTFILPIIEQLDDKSRVHPSYLVHGTKTGRLSSRDPNLQNIPRESDIRRLFSVPHSSRAIVEADFHQLEIVVFKHFAHVDFAGDFHQLMASIWFEKSIEEVTKEERNHGKRINFAILYGMREYGMAKKFNVSIEFAKNVINNFEKLVPGMKDFKQFVFDEINSKGYIENLFGRRRRVSLSGLNDFLSQHGYKDAYNARESLKALAEWSALKVLDETKAMQYHAERQAFNFPIQSTAADITNLALIGLWNRLTETLMSSKIINQVHDSILIECDEVEAAFVGQLCKEVMETPYLSVPLKVEVKISKSWGN